MGLALGLLVVAITTAVAATAALPRTDSFQHPGWTALVIGGYAISIYLLSVIVRTIPVSVTYAIWAGVGTAAIAVVGVVALGDQMDWLKAAAIALIVIGVIVLNLHGVH
jgi:small multidrug resistance pump